MAFPIKKLKLKIVKCILHLVATSHFSAGIHVAVFKFKKKTLDGIVNS